MIQSRFPTTNLPQSQFRILVQQFESSMSFASGTTRHVYMKALEQLLLFAEGNQFKFTPEDFTQFRLWMLNGRKLSNNTVNTYMTASRRFCEFLVDLGVLHQNPAWNVHGSAQSFNVTKVSLTEVTHAISRIDRSPLLGKRDYAFLSVMFECGATISELINADIGDLKRSGEVVELRVKPKGTRGKYEVIKLTKASSSAVCSYIDARGAVASDFPLFSTVNAGRATSKRLSFRGARAAMRKRLTIDEKRALRLDSLRTYCAVRLMKQGKTSEEIRSLMRFKSNMPFRKIMINSKAMAEKR
jgi:site-specific recombinase XerC